MKVAISGASGLVGSALAQALETRGDLVVPMVRPRSAGGAVEDESIPWDPSAGRLDPGTLRGVDAIVHLAGESIASGMWTRKKKARIRASRVRGTELIARAVVDAPEGPRILLSASAIGIYGSRGDEWLDESSTQGEGFLADVCQAWEAAADPAREAGLRVVHPRIGLVLSGRGGLLARMVGPFRWGLGGRLGNGRHWMSWITLEDVVGALVHLLDREVEGPVNLVGPTPATNRDFTRQLGRAVHRPALVPAPAFALRLLPGDMGEELLLSSARVRPSRLLETGFSFAGTELSAVLSRELEIRKAVA